MVVPVLITSCHVSEYLNAGPVTAQTRTTRTARKNAVDDPIATAESRANFRKLSLIFTTFLHSAELRVERPEFPLRSVRYAPHAPWTGARGHSHKAAAARLPA